MEDKILTAKETTDELTVEPTTELVPLYLVLDTSNRVIDLSLEKGTFYQDIPPDADLEQIKIDLNISSQAIYWDSYLYENKPDLVAENKMLKRQVQTLSSELEIRDDILQDIILSTFN